MPNRTIAPDLAKPNLASAIAVDQTQPEPDLALINAPEPLISVVIPTYRRPQLVKRAIQSALNQTLQAIEVIVVIHGDPDGSTGHALADLQDPRLRVVTMPTNLGSAAPARNAGVEQARADWIAHLDDDDEWMPEKLERQYAAVCQSSYRWPIATCQLQATGQTEVSIQPRRIPEPGEPMGDYLFVRRSFFQGEAIIQGSTILVAKALMQQVPFCLAAGKHDDWEWLLQASQVPGAGLEFVSEPLSIWHLEHESASMSRTHNWQHSLEWARRNQQLFSRRAYSSFMLIEISSHAAFNRDWHAVSLLLKEAISHGQPRPVDYLLFAGMWLVSPTQRGWLRSILKKTN
jgi:glycosyltransferase involved in cell wall biosynthesis